MPTELERLQARVEELEAELVRRAELEAERRAADARAQHTRKLESLGLLAGSIAHDFANTLLAVLGNTSLALEDLPHGSPVRANLEQIEASARSATQLCQQMLAYSGQGQVAVRSLDLTRVIQETSHMLDASVSRKARLRQELASDLPTMEGDASQVAQVVMNLVTNASEAVGEPDGAVTVRTGAQHCDRADLASCLLDDGHSEGTYVFVEVSDNGRGMDEATRMRLFEPFFSTKFPGRGQGLATVLGIVRGHRGVIEVRSELGQGTAIKVAFPVSEHAAESYTDEPGPERPGLDWRGSGLALVVDDEEAVRSVGQQILERVGFEVLTAEDGREAVQIFESRPADFEFVLLDLTMPVMDGEETLAALRAIRPDIPVLMSSGYSTAEVEQRFRDKGHAGFIQKPYAPHELVAWLAEVLGQGD